MRVSVQFVQSYVIVVFCLYLFVDPRMSIYGHTSFLKVVTRNIVSQIYFLVT